MPTLTNLFNVDFTVPIFMAAFLFSFWTFLQFQGSFPRRRQKTITSLLHYSQLRWFVCEQLCVPTRVPQEKKVNIYCSGCPNNYLSCIKLNAISKAETYYVYYNFFNEISFRCFCTLLLSELSGNLVSGIWLMIH